MLPYSQKRHSSRSGIAFSLTVLVGVMCFMPQVSAQQQLLNPSTLPGPQPYTTVASDSELVNNANGSVLVSIPLLHLPGINGLDLDLSVNYTSKHWDLSGSVMEATGTYSGTQQQSITNASLQWSNNLSVANDFGGTMLSVPRLFYSNQYLTTNITSFNDGGSESSYQPIYCASSFVYMDESGGMHTFLNRRDCYPVSPGSGFPTINVSDSGDTSLIRLDTTSLSDMKVYLKNGDVVHFAGTQSTSGGITVDNPTPIYPSYIQDPNGNRITFSTVTSSGFSITDSLGRIVTVQHGSGTSTIQYKDSNGTPRSIVATSTTAQGSDVTLHASQCSGPYWNNNTVTIPTSSVSDFGSTNSLVSIVLDSGDIARTYAVTTDSVGEPIEVKLPSGGYNRYAYQSYQGHYTASPFVCGQYDVREISQKFACRSSSGSCGQEDTTTYTPAIAGTANSSMTVLDPADVNGQQRKTVFNYSPTIPSNRFASSHETSRSIYGNQTNLLETVTTQYLDDLSSQVGSGYLSVVALPQTVSTVTAKNGGSLTTTSSMQYDSMSLTNMLFTNSQGNTTFHIDNVVQLTQSDFSGNTIKTTTNAWDYIGPHIWNRLSSATVSGSGVSSVKSFGYDGNGNVTSSSVGGKNAANATTGYQVNSYGQTTQITDPKGNLTKYAYTNAWFDQICAVPSTTANGPSSITDALGHATSFLYYSCSGRRQSALDPNNQKTSYVYDALARTTSVKYPDGGNIAYGYTDTAPNSILTTKQLSASGTPGPLVSEEIMDGLGRPSQSQLQSDPAGITYTDTTYDAPGRVASVSNPYRTTPDSSYITAFQYDAMDRKTLETAPDKSSRTWCYNGVFGPTGTCRGQIGSQLGTWIDSSDEVGNSWQYTSDSLGRMVAAIEPNGTAATPSMETDYTYNILGNLTAVNQWGGANGSAGVRSRAFSYDGLSRLLTSNNPESGTISYSYLASGALCSGDVSQPCSKTDARNIAISYAYDALNRLTAKTGTGINYSYFYDIPNKCGFTAANPIGRLVGSSNGVNASTCYSYDSMGRVIGQEGCTPASCGSAPNPLSATYDLAGNMTSLTYPDGRLVSQAFDAASHLSSMSYTGWNGAAQSVSYLSVSSSNGYDAAGHLVNATMGNGVGFAASYNNREEISSLAYGTSAQLLWGKQLTWTANGNLQGTSDPLTSIRRQFGYDSLNRLTSAQDIFAASAVPDTSPFPIGAGGVNGSNVTSDGATAVWTNPDDSNILINPDQPGAWGWGVANSTITNGVLAPDGTTTAATFTATSGSTDTYLAASAEQGSLLDGETMTGSVWLRAPNGAQTMDLFLVESGTAGYAVPASKQVTVTTTWQQFQISGKFQYGHTELLFQIGGAGSITSGQAISLWGSKLEDSGTSGADVTNYLPYSQLLTSPTWGVQAGTFANTSGIAPDGSNTAITVTAASGSTDTWMVDNVPNPAPYSGTPVTGSIWLRSPAGAQNILLTLITTNSATLGAKTVALTSAWQRFQVSGTTPVGLTELQLQIGGAQTFTNGQSVQIWGGQLELTSTAGPYVATDASPVTRGTNLTNLLPYSQQPNGPSWGLANATGITNAVAAPDGSMTGFQMTAASGVPDAWATNDVSNTALYDGATVTSSIFLRVPGSTALNVYVYLFGQNASGRTPLGSKLVQLNGNWQRFTMTGTLPNGLTRIFLQIGGSSSFSSGQVLDLWGSQLELASSAGPYVMTTALPVVEGKELTNILPNSQMVSGPNWGVANGSAANNSAVAPDGTSTASTVTATASSPDTYTMNSVPNPSLYDGETVTASVYLRVASGTLNTDLFLINVGDNGWSAPAQVPVTLTTTWQRFSVTGTNQNGLSTLLLQIGGAGTVTAGASFQVWGTQMVVGSSAAPYMIAVSGTTNTATGQAAAIAPNGLNQSFTYDSFGNLQQNGSFNSSYTAQNQMLAYAYDAAGNLLSDGMNIMTWDADGRLASAGGATYVYNPEGDRVEKQGVGVTDTVYFGGRPIARLSAGAWTDLIYGPNGLLAEVPGTQTATPSYRLLDHLGTQVGTVGSNGLLVNPMDYTPFGQAFSGATSDPYVYTGKERDAESGLDYFGARYMSSNMGRFMSPDWSDDPDPIPYADTENPQSLNLYAYVNNNPLTGIDDDGHVDCQTKTQDVVCLVQTAWNWLTSRPGPQAAVGAYKELSNEGNDFGRLMDRLQGNPTLQRRPQNYQLNNGAQKVGAFVAGIGAMFIPGGGEAEGLQAVSRAGLLNEISNPALRRAIEAIYRETAAVGDGSTAAAIEEEIATGQPVGGKWHSIKGRESINRLKRILNDQSLTPRERAVARYIISRTETALGIRGPS